VTLTFDVLTLKVVSESRVTWATSVPILVFLGLCHCVLDLGPMYATDVVRQTSDIRQHHRLMPLPKRRGHIKWPRRRQVRGCQQRYLPHRRTINSSSSSSRSDISQRGTTKLLVGGWVVPGF